MIEKTKKYDIGVVIGRFQVHQLHQAHKDMIEMVISNHKKVIMFLGMSKSVGTKTNPLDFTSRKEMMIENYGSDISAVLPIQDVRDDMGWSKEIDKRIREIFPMGSVVLYGSRDSFIPHYLGQFDTCELVPSSFVSGTQVREEVSREVIKSEEFRAGVIYSTYNRFPTVFSTVDIAVIDESKSKVLLGRKPSESSFRFIGGFVDIADKSFEEAAKRELTEEAGNIETSPMKYLGSGKVSDWRYDEKSGQSVMTHLFLTQKIFGIEKANDDIEELKWFVIDDIAPKNVVDEHIFLLDMLKNELSKGF